MTRRSKKMPTKELLREWFHYEPESGVFTWIKEPRKVGPLLGKIAGHVSINNYRYIRVPGHGLIGAQRLAWIYMYGPTIGDLTIDHIDVNPLNNSISNLRLATLSQQGQNKHVRSDSRSGLRGAFYNPSRKKSWYSQIRVDGKCFCLGNFHTPEEAHAAYCEAALKHHGEFARAA